MTKCIMFGLRRHVNLRVCAGAFAIAAGLIVVLAGRVSAEINHEVVPALFANQSDTTRKSLE